MLLFVSFTGLDKQRAHHAYEAPKDQSRHITY